MKLKILGLLILSLLAPRIFAVNPLKQYLHWSSPFDLAVDSAALALHISDHPQNVNQLSLINVKDLINLRKLTQGNCISYYADLPNGDVLSCDYFIAGPCKGQTDCTRLIRTANSMTVMLPVRASLYNEIEQLYNRQNSQLQA